MPFLLGYFGKGLFHDYAKLVAARHGHPDSIKTTEKNNFTLVTGYYSTENTSSDKVIPIESGCLIGKIFNIVPFKCKREYS